MRRVDRVEVVCQTCGKIFMERASKGRMFCSRKCTGIDIARRYKEKRVNIVCLHCGKTFEVFPASKSKYCSLHCKQVYISRSTSIKRGNMVRGIGKDGGDLKRNTYIKFHGVHLHRILAEKKIGRQLLPGEIVHHIDGDRHNNAPENLVVTTQAEHARRHSVKNKKCSIPGCERKHSAKGFCYKHWKRNIRCGSPYTVFKKGQRKAATLKGLIP